MREIKFRAWNPDSKCMVYVPDGGGYLHLGHQSGFIAELDWFVADKEASCAYSDRSVLMQYTGLKDKNGKEIYEGDIVSQKTPTGKEAQRGEVRWSTEETGYHIGESIEWRLGIYAGMYGANSLEIIGNIYENPELLTN